jgi:hypothetical protein
MVDETIVSQPSGDVLSASERDSAEEKEPFNEAQNTVLRSLMQRGPDQLGRALPTTFSSWMARRLVSLKRSRRATH